MHLQLTFNLHDLITIMESLGMTKFYLSAKALCIF